MFFLLKKEYKTILYTFIGIILIHILITLYWGTPLMADYFKYQAASYFGMGELTGWLNKSIAATLYRLFSISNPENNTQPIMMAPWIVLPARIIVTLTVLACLAFFTLKNYDENLVFPLYLISIFMITPMVWVHHHVLILMALPIFIECILQGRYPRGLSFITSLLFILFFWILGTFNGWVSFPMNPFPYYSRVGFHNSNLSTFFMIGLWITTALLIFFSKTKEAEQICPASDKA
jgi:hypothetical protein